MQKKQPKTIVFFTVFNSIFIQFLLGIFGIFIWLKFSTYCPNDYLKFLLIAIGYGGYFYLTTPFLLHCLTYASTGKLTQFKLLLVIVVVGIYSYIIWDSYFFFKETIQSLMSGIRLEEF
ncbi:hypothetical protein Sta7437_0019 [Stanieria cyanosphaera PCC 7437]|uniref:Uncharacterized protein n=1 Tax=Stanieria cyanosphaera (strain ATCC 29371 / PCC 7437) TaxID=111780 RepID=K9XM21_STAC7|nr:hypothetical protein Sta7437_0019 [Stanieria cyanosphaera PCC 7437]